MTKSIECPLICQMGFNPQDLQRLLIQVLRKLVISKYRQTSFVYTPQHVHRFQTQKTTMRIGRVPVVANKDLN